MTSFTSWGSIFLFSATILAVLFQSVILWAALYIVGAVCFFLAHRQEQHLLKRVVQLESQVYAVTAKITRSGES